MALVYQNLTLEVTPGMIPPVLHVTEYDINMQIDVTFTQRGQPFEIPSGTTAKVEGTLAGHPFRENCTVNGSTVTFILSEGMTAYAGRAWTKIVLTKDGLPVSTCGFWLDCDRAGVEADTVIGAPGFEEQINQAVDEYLDENDIVTPIVVDIFGHAYLAPIALSDLGEDLADGYTMQGGAVNSDTGEILIAFRKANTAASILKLLNADWLLKETYSAEIGHANDLTYAPDDKAFYIADGETEGLIHILDADSMKITGTKQIPNVGVIASIDYLPRQQIFFICDYPSKKLYRCSKDFSKVTSVAGIPNTVKEYDTARSSPYMQGGAVIGEEYVQALWYYGAENKGSSYTRLWFLPFSGSGSHFVDIRSQSLQDESEFLLVDGGEAVLVGYADGYITRCGIYAAGSTYDPVIALDGAMCRSVDHIPVNSMGRVRLHQNTSPTGQEITADYHCYGDGADKTLEITYGGRKYYRVKSSGAWGSWVGSLDSGGTAIQGRYVPSSAVNGLRLTHGDNAFSALVMIRSNQGLSDTLFFVAGYGVGGAARDHAHMLISNTGEVYYSYEIDGQSIVIHSTAAISNVSITILSGSLDDLSVSWEVT